MQITDGTTTLTFTGTRFDDFTDIEQSETKTGSGEIKTIRAGNRFVATEQLRLTGSEYESLRDVLLSGASTFFYTPTVIPDYMESTDFPMSVSISAPKKRRQSGGGTKKYFIELSIKGVAYL